MAKAIRRKPVKFRRWQLEQNYEFIAEDKAFHHLRRAAKQMVKGEGTLSPLLMIVGEAPGKQEDEEGRPFVGKSGLMLTMLLKRIGLERGDCFITNVVKYRPANNRDPNPTELEAAAPYLHREVRILRPNIVVPVGRFAYKLLGGEDRPPITKAHGKPYKWEGGFLIPLLHPAYVMRNMDLMPAMEFDIDLIKYYLDKDHD